MARLQRSAGNSAVLALLALNRAGGRATTTRLQRAETGAETSGGGESSGGWLEKLNPFAPTEGEKNDTGASPGVVWRWLSWAGIGLADLVAGCIEWFGLEDYDISADLMRHYMSGRGAEYELEVPQEWIDKIAQVHRKPGTFKDVSSYAWGIPDMKNSLGHFDLTVTPVAGGSMLYEIHDKYWFPYKPNDKKQTGRHGFEVDFFGALPVEAQKTINDSLAALGTWHNPGGFDEKFEVVKLSGKWTFLIPQQWLADSGVNFDVHAVFVAQPGGAGGGGTAGEGEDEGGGWFGGWF